MLKPYTEVQLNLPSAPVHRLSLLLYEYICVQARSGGSRKGAGRRKISYSTRPSSSTKRLSRNKRLSEHEKEDLNRPFHVGPLVVRLTIINSLYIRLYSGNMQTFCV